MSITKDDSVKVKPSPYFKLRKEKGKNFQAMTLLKQFGFIPDTIIIERMGERNNVIRILAVLTEAEKKKEKDLLVKKVKGQ